MAVQQMFLTADWNWNITPVDVVKVTEFYATIVTPGKVGGTRLARKHFFDTWADAHANLKLRAAVRLEAANVAARRVLAEYERIAALKPPGQVTP